jgi:hypothetical protein
LCLRVIRNSSETSINMKQIAPLSLLLSASLFLLFCFPVAAETLYTADLPSFSNSTINGVSTNRTVSVFASGYSGRVNQITWAQDGYLYAANTDLNRILKISSSGAVTTFASGDLLSNPTGIAFDSLGVMYVANYAFPTGGTVLKLLSDGSMSQFSVGTIGSGGGSLAFDNSGFLYAAAYVEGIVYRLNTDGQVSVFASGFSSPTGLAFDSHGDLYVANQTGSISRVIPNGTVSTFSSDTLLSGVNSVAFDSLDNLYVGNAGSGQILTVDSSGVATVYANGVGSVTGIAFVPEPSTYALLLFSGAASLWHLKRRKS